MEKSIHLFPLGESTLEIPSTLDTFALGSNPKQATESECWDWIGSENSLKTQ